MFNKLLTSLPFNPGMLGQVAFYAKRLHKETAVRRVGFIMTGLAMLVQIFAVLGPAQPSFAYANANDVVYGGGTRDSILSAYRTNTDSLGRHDIKAIYDYFLGGGSAADTAIANGVDEDIYSSPENNYWSVGRNVRDSADISMTVPGSQSSLYGRTLSGWAVQTWHAIKVKSAINGQYMWILRDCGNIVTKGPYQYASPNVSIDKVATPGAGSHVAPGSVISYAIYWNNSGPGNMLDVQLYDNLPAQTSLVEGSIGGTGGHLEGGVTLRWSDQVWGTAKGTASYKVKVSPTAPDGARICNTAKITWLDNGQRREKSVPYEVCNIVTTPKCTVTGKTNLPASSPDCKEVPKCQYDASIPASSSACRPPCQYNTQLRDTDAKCQAPQSASCSSLEEVKPAKSRTERQFKAKATTENGAQIIDYQFDYNNDGQVDKVIAANGAKEVNFDYAFPAEGKAYQSRVMVRANINGKPTVVSSFCKLAIDIPEPPTVPKTPILSTSKKATNVTAKLTDANKSTAHPGDVIQYSLTTQNVGSGDAKQATLTSEDMRDVLEYADLVSLGDGIMNSDSKVVTWAQTDIPAGGSVTKTISVKIKDPLPATPVSVSVPGSFDLKLQNHYGNDIEINLTPPAAKQVENVGKSLPNTGPGTSLVIVFFITMIVGYFLARSRIMAKELDIIRSEYAQGGL